MTKNQNKLNRYKGCLIGLAVGDALGAPAEWKKRFKPITGMRASRTHGLKKGMWTDDTSMAIATAHSLINKGFNPQDQLTNYLAWYRYGLHSAQGKCVGIGRTTRESLERFEAFSALHAQQSDASLAGNGSIMRIAPIPMFATTLQDAGILAVINSMTTHQHKLCSEAAQVFSQMIFLALKGTTKQTMFDLAKSGIKISNVGVGTYSKEIKEIFEKKTYKYCNPPHIEGSGYVVKSLEAALWAFSRSRSFKHGALLAVNLGGDTDTIGALYGQLAGAYYGYDKIPQEWRDQLYKHDLIQDYAVKLYNLNKTKKK